MDGTAVSIILPVYERLRFLRPAVESVLAQTLTNWELIVADDGSADETRAYLRSLVADSRIRVLELEHSGSPNVARNAALRCATARRIAFIDSDDAWAPNKLAVQLAAMDRDGSRWSYTAVVRIDADGRRMIGDDDRSWTPHRGAVFERLVTFEAAVATPAVIVERELLAEVGGFDEQQVMYGDYDLWLRLALRADVSAYPEPLALVRSHDEHYTSGGLRKIAARRRLLEKMRDVVSDPHLREVIDRQRASNALDAALAFGALGDIKATARALRESVKYSWNDAHWWLRGGRAFASSMLPSPVRALTRRVLGRPGAQRRVRPL